MALRTLTFPLFLEKAVITTVVLLYSNSNFLKLLLGLSANYLICMAFIIFKCFILTGN